MFRIEVKLIDWLTSRIEHHSRQPYLIFIPFNSLCFFFCCVPLILKQNPLAVSFPVVSTSSKLHRNIKKWCDRSYVKSESYTNQRCNLEINAVLYPCYKQTCIVCTVCRWYCKQHIETACAKLLWQWVENAYGTMLGSGSCHPPIFQWNC